MPVFDILCLANSNKMRGACVAGLRLDGGGWIRPVTRTPHGELYPAHYILQDGTCPQIFDRLLISFLEPQPLAHQPENWLIADQPWQLVSRGLRANFSPLLESHLIQGPALLGDFSHKIPFDRFRTEPAASSLCLIRPANLRWAIEQLPYNAHKASAQFQLAGTSYRLSITDPAWLDTFRALAPGKYPVTTSGIRPEQQVLLTISLSEPWEDGFCYKLAAGILPLEPSPIAGPPEVAKPPELAKPPKLPKPPDEFPEQLSGQPLGPYEAARIIQALAAGADPHTGQPIPGGGPLSHPETIRALWAAAEALRIGAPGEKPPDLPPHAGKPWDTAEEELLTRAFEVGETMAAMARAHGRTPGAIKARLIRLGKIEG